MKRLCLLAWLALASACSSFGVRCDTRLRPINLMQPPINGLPAGAPTTKVPSKASLTSKISAPTSPNLERSPGSKFPASTSPTPKVPAAGSGSPEKP